MLTGGLRILGIFVFGPSDVRTRLQAKFRQTLYSFNKMTCNEFMLAKWKIEQSSGQIIFQVCSETKKYPLKLPSSYIHIEITLVLPIFCSMMSQCLC